MCPLWAQGCNAGRKRGKSSQNAGGTVSGNSKPKYEPAIYMFKETAENGVQLKEYRCVLASQVNNGKPSYGNKIIRRDFNESFSLLNLF